MDNNAVEPLLGESPGAKLPEAPGAPGWRGKCKSCFQTRAVKMGCIGCWSIIAIIFALVWALQGILYGIYTMHCSADSLERYTYPGGEASAKGNASYNLVPRINLLKERPPRWFGEAFDVVPSNAASTISEAPVGSIWKMWGPVFYTYTYQDVINSQETVYMRRNLMRLGMSHRIYRCDGKGPYIWVEEGSNWFTNRVRHAFGMSQSTTFKIYVNDDYVATIEETNQGVPSMTFATHSEHLAARTRFASSVLKNPMETQKYSDEWLVSNEFKSALPYWMPTMTTAIFSFALAGHDHHKDGHSSTGDAFMAVSETAPTPQDVQKPFAEETIEEGIEEEA